MDISLVCLYEIACKRLHNRKSDKIVPSAPTLEDVAAKAGVSTATVSRCLNSPEKVVPDTRERVLRIVGELGYAPNFGARALAARRTQTMGAVIPTMENAIFAEGLQAFQEGLREAGFMLLVASSAYDPDVEADQIRALVARGAEGLLLIGHDRDPQIYRFLETQGVPVLAAWAYDDARPSIGFDNRAAMRALAERAISLGHRRIGVISAYLDGNDRARRRVAGVRDALADAGVEVEFPVVETEYGISNGAEAFLSLMSREDNPTLVICGNDVLAAGALKQAISMGLRIPEDISITGFDGIELASLVTPNLTTVRVPHRDMGEAAAKALIAMSRGDSAGQSICLDTTLQPGGTLGPAP